MNRKSNKLSDQLRRIINESDTSRYAIWRATGVDQAILSKFMSGKGGLSMNALDKLGKFLELEFKTQKKPKKGR